MEMQVDGKDISSLRVVDLKAELEKRGQSKAGTKKDLAERLIKYLKTHPGKHNTVKIQIPKNSSIPVVKVYWTKTFQLFRSFNALA